MSHPAVQRISTVLCLLSGATALHAQAPDTLRDRDLVIASLPHASDTSGTKRLLGTPTQVLAPTRNDDGVLLTRWVYSGLELSFDSTGHRYLADVTNPVHHTTRGIRIGDSLQEVRRVYGKPHFEDSSHLLYVLGHDVWETRGITFMFSAGRLTRMIIGEVISVS